MDKIRNLIERFNALWECDFYRGVLLTLAIILGVCLIYFILKMIFWMKFQWRRCREIVIEMPAGCVTVSEQALTAALQSELAKFRQLLIRKIVISRKKKNYRMVIFATLAPFNGTKLLPELFMAVKPLLTSRMEELFGIKDFNDINIRIEEFLPEEDDEDAATVAPQAVDKPVTYMEYPGN